MLMPLATGAGSITVTPTAQAPGASVSIAGTGFGATRNVTIGFGNEINITQEPTTFIITSPVTVASNWTHRPIKPGSLRMHIKNIGGPFPGLEYDVTDEGAENLYATGAGIYDHTLWGTIDYALGGFLRNTTFVGMTPDDLEVTASYKSYQYNNVTSFGRVATTGLGAFSANFTVPAVANGNYNVTAIDSGGTMTTTTLSVSNVIPEVLPFGAILLLSSLAVLAGSLHFRKRPRITE